MFLVGTTIFGRREYNVLLIVPQKLRWILYHERTVAVTINIVGLRIILVSPPFLQHPFGYPLPNLTGCKVWLGDLSNDLMFGVCINRSRPSGLWIFEMPRSGVLKNSRPKLIKISETISLYWFFCDSSGPYIPCSSFKPNLGNFSSSTRPPYFLFLGSWDFFGGFVIQGLIHWIWSPASLSREFGGLAQSTARITVRLWTSNPVYFLQRYISDYRRHCSDTSGGT